MLDFKHASKIKNDKVLRWRLELAAFDFTTIYRPGNLNCAPNTFSRPIPATITLMLKFNGDVIYVPEI